MSVKGSLEWFTELPQRLTPKQNEIARRACSRRSATG